MHTHSYTHLCTRAMHTREHGLGGRADTASGRPQDVEIPHSRVGATGLTKPLTQA